MCQYALQKKKNLTKLTFAEPWQTFTFASSVTAGCAEQSPLILPHCQQQQNPPGVTLPLLTAPSLMNGWHSLAILFLERDTLARKISPRSIMISLHLE